MLFSWLAFVLLLQLCCLLGWLPALTLLTVLTAEPLTHHTAAQVLALALQLADAVAREAL
jgi:hypothetical protein